MPVSTFVHQCFALLVLLAVGRGTAASAQEASPQILFLHLKLQSNQVALVSASTVLGTLKRIPATHGALDLEVATAAGQVLWTNSVADPALRRLEYEDPANPGQILAKEVPATNAEFMVRVPAFPNAHHVKFFRKPAPVGTNAPANKNGAGAVSSDPRTPLGVVTLPVANK